MAVQSASNSLKAVATGQTEKSKNPVAAFSNFLERYKPQMALALPKHLNADRMARLAVTAFASTPKLAECAPESVIGAIMNASIMGLEIGVNGQGFLVPYGRTATFVPGWKGLVDLVSRSGRASVWTGAVFDGDFFEYAQGDKPFVTHRPGLEDDPAKMTHVYAVGRVNGSDWPVIEVWPIEKVKRHRDKYNKQALKHYSYRDWEMYARKVPLLQVLKYMPSSIELSLALDVANASEEGRGSTIDGKFFVMADQQPDETTGDAGQAPDDGQDDETVSKADAPKPRQAKQQPPADDPVTASYAYIMAALNEATKQQARDDAATLITVANIPDEGQRKELSMRYQELSAE